MSIWTWIPQAVGSFGGTVMDIWDRIDEGPENEARARYEQARNDQRYYFDANASLQREFAQHGVRWRAEDLKAAGLNPAMAAGGGGASFSPISVGEVTAPNVSQDKGWGDIFRQTGQDISRAVRATSDEATRQQLEFNDLQNENMKLQNALLGQKIVGTQQSQIGPAMPEEKGINADISFTKTKTGGLAPVPSEAFADRAEDQWLPQIAWAARNLLSPVDPDNRGLKDGEVWMWNPYRFEFQKGKPESFRPDLQWYNKGRHWLNNTRRYDYGKTYPSLIPPSPLAPLSGRTSSPRQTGRFRP